MQIECSLCDSTGWVCEDHRNLPWGDASSRPDACNCGGAGAPCPACNPCDREHPPRLPDGYRSFLKTWGGSNMFCESVPLGAPVLGGHTCSPRFSMSFCEHHYSMPAPINVNDSIVV